MTLPNDTQRLAIVGRTGSGKTQAAAWHLSMRRFDLMPWVVVDYKMDPLLNNIAGATHITLDDSPDRPGVYLVHPQPDDIIGVESFLWKIWERGNTGVYVDEGYMICPPGRPNKAFRALLTQGRSKRIPMIVLSQRPVWLDRFVYSESEFFQVFALQDSGDRKRVMEFVPADLDEKLPKYHSYYHDIAEDNTLVLKPVPSGDKILANFSRRFEAMQEKPKRPYIFV